MKKYSRIYKVGRRNFRYNYERNVIEWIAKMTDDLKADNEEWRSKYGEDLWEVTEDGYNLVDTIGCFREDWEESPREMCEMWYEELQEEIACYSLAV